MVGTQIKSAIWNKLEDFDCINPESLNLEYRQSHFFTQNLGYSHFHTTVLGVGSNDPMNSKLVW